MSIDLLKSGRDLIHDLGTLSVCYPFVLACRQSIGSLGLDPQEIGIRLSLESALKVVPERKLRIVADDVCHVAIWVCKVRVMTI